MINSFSKLSSTFSAVKLDFKEEQASEASGSTSGSSNSTEATSSTRPKVVRLISTRAIQGRAPVPSIEQQLLRRARAAAVAGNFYFYFFINLTIYFIFH